MFRSQLAEYFFNKSAKKHRAESAGINARYAGIRLSRLYHIESGRAKDAEKFIAELDKEMLEKVPKQLTPEMIDASDKVVVLLESEKEMPDYLKNSPKLIFWKMIDGIKEDGSTRPYGELCRIREQIKEKVEKLVKSIS